MLPDTTSRHLRGATELMLLFPVKRGFVPISDRPLSYATRLRALFRAVFDLRLSLTEKDVGVSAGPIERLQSIFFAQWTILEDEQRLLVSVSFDRSWEDYVQILVDEAGPSLDAFFCHCSDYQGFSCRDGYHAFSQWLRRHQVPCDLFYGGAVDLTVDDLSYLRKLAAVTNPSARSIAQLNADATGQQAKTLTDDEAASRVYRALTGLQDLRWMFAGSTEKHVFRKTDLSAADVFNQAVYNLVPDIRLAAQPPRTPPPELAGWLAQLNRVPAAQARSASLPDAKIGADVQGNILTGYDDMNIGCLVLLSASSPEQARAFLGSMAKNVTTEESARRLDPSEARSNVAITYPGLRRLGLSDEVLAPFPSEFREGMEQRAGLLGDIGDPHHPDYWELPEAFVAGGESDPAEQTARSKRRPRVALSSVDFVVQLQRHVQDCTIDQWSSAHPLHAEVMRLEGAGIRILHVQPLLRERLGDQREREHFGFVEDKATMSQPVPRVRLDDRTLDAGAYEGDKVALGELLLGYPDARGDEQPIPDDISPLFRNASFLVLRKLEQDVQEFERFAEENARALGVTAEMVKSWAVGRTPDGAPLAKPDAKANAFCYDDDPAGAACPFASHIRRTNPRTIMHGQPNPRIMRRGFAYGRRWHPESAPESKRGLMFMAYNASIARQFEVIQRWVNGGNSTGVLSAHNDLFCGTPQPSGIPRWAHAASLYSSTDRLEVRKPFVSLRWGMYLFVPSRGGLLALSDPRLLPSNTGQRTKLGALGRKVIASLPGAKSSVRPEMPASKSSAPSTAIDPWKQLIEEPTTFHRSRATAVWSALLGDDHGGLLETPYGFLAAGKQLAGAVLSDDGSAFSVEEYQKRLSSTIGNHYLGFDSGNPSYLKDSSAPNAYFRSITEDEAYADAHRSATEFLNGELPRVPDAPDRKQIHLDRLAFAVVAKWAEKWLGLRPATAPCPKAEAAFGQEGDWAGLATMLQPFVDVSKYGFFPYPNDALQADAAEAKTKAIREQGVDCAKLIESMASYETVSGVDRAQLLRSVEKLPLALQGGIVGFAAPAISCIVVVLDQWIESRQLWRFIDTAEQSDDPERRGAMKRALLEALQRAPVPPILYRKAQRDFQHGKTTISKDSFVIVGVASACDEERAEQARAAPAPNSDEAKAPWKWLFGGSSPEQPHACPARDAALGVVLGAICALLERTDLKRERKLVLSFS